MRRYFCKSWASHAEECDGITELPGVFKRFEINKVWRESSDKGLPLELMRADFDVLGVDRPGAEIEHLNVVNEVGFSGEIRLCSVR